MRSRPRIDAARLAEREDAGKALREAGAELARVEIDRACSLLAEDRARHDVARRELGEAVALDHEALAAELTRIAPSPRTASEISASGFSGVSSAVG